MESELAVDGDKAQPESDILAAIQETVAGLRNIGLVDQATMRKFDAMCLTTAEPLRAEEIRALQEPNPPASDVEL